jgi:Zn-dependent peptidase ImmA (M78 family)
MTLDEIKNKYKGQIPVPIVSIATDLGIDVYETDDLNKDISGSITNNNGKYVIQVNDKHSSLRQRFTIAHEIGHYFKHSAFLTIGKEIVDPVKQPVLYRSDHPATEEELDMDREANIIAADLLMPEDEFKKAWEESSSIEEVADKFKVSVSAVVVRGNILMNQAMM